MKTPHFFNIDDRRKMIAINGHQNTIEFMALHFIAAAKEAIMNRGHFYVALSGGSTPRAVYSELAIKHAAALDWKSVSFFFSDERSVEENDSESNYFSAMEAGIKKLALPHQVHRMVAEKSIEKNAQAYEDLIRKLVPNCSFDLILLGMGDDGHTASLFPHTEALKVENRLVVQNYVPAKKTWRMTFTYPLLHLAKACVFYAMGSGKKEMVKTVLCKNFSHLDYPASIVGNKETPAIWILDKEASF